MSATHMLAAARPLCETDSSVDRIGRATKAIFNVVDCPDCLRRAIAESEERARVLRDLLGRVETLS